MKKILTHIAVIAATVGCAHAQSQRLEIYEEFTGENCGPCAATNPGLDALHNTGTNLSKIIFIKYQCNIPSAPGAGSIYSEVKNIESVRQTYYSVPFAPYARFNGGVIPDPQGTNNGHAALLTQKIIDDSSTVSSPFTMTTTHTFSPAYDSVFLNITVTCTKAITGTLKLQVAMLETEMHYASPTGTNGEKDFFYEMRQMYPDANGTTITGTWAVNDTKTYTIRGAVPSYIRDLSKVAMVTFIQNDANKSICQTGYSAPKQLSYDAGISNITGINMFQCSNSFTPSVTIQNFGSATLTSATINYKMDNGTANTQAWTGSLATNATVVVALPVQTSTPGQHSFTAYTSNPNGQTDYGTLNNTSSSVLDIYTPKGTAIPLTQDFQGANFPPAGWIINNSDNGITWQQSTQAGGFSATGTSAKINFNADPTGQTDDLLTPNFDLTGASAPISLKFDEAYAQADATRNDAISVLVSTDCGVTWTTISQRSGANLATSPVDNTTFFYPTAAQWRRETVDMSTYIGQSNVLVAFRATSGGYGNNGFIDNVNIGATATGIRDIKNTENIIRVQPNPFAGTTNIVLNLNKAENVKLNIYNAVGELVYSANKGLMNEGEHSIQFNGENLPTGIYSLIIVTDQNTYTTKLSLMK